MKPHCKPSKTPWFSVHRNCGNPIGCNWYLCYWFQH